MKATNIGRSDAATLDILAKNKAQERIVYVGRKRPIIMIDPADVYTDEEWIQYFPLFSRLTIRPSSERGSTVAAPKWMKKTAKKKKSKK